MRLAIMENTIDGRRNSKFTSGGGCRTFPCLALLTDGLQECKRKHHYEFIGASQVDG